ncbi:Ltp family lipoprotein [Arthrobacter sp. NPDC055585]
MSAPSESRSEQRPVDVPPSLAKALPKKPIWTVMALAGVFFVGGCTSTDSGSDSESSSSSPSTATAQETTAPPTEQMSETPSPTESPAAEEPVPPEYQSALRQAETYANTLQLSKLGVYDQLVSEYGGQFSPEAAQYAVDNVKADWNQNALESAKSYQDTMAMSPSAIYDQLVSEFGGKFTPEEADYAIQNLNN